MNLVRYHESGVESQTEMSDDLVFVCLVLIFLQELCCTGKCDLSDVFFHLVSSHTKTGINELQCLLFRIHDHFNLVLMSFRECILTHNLQFFQFGDGITSVGNHLTEKNVMVRIQPFLDNRKNIVAIN